MPHAEDLQALTGSLINDFNQTVINGLESVSRWIQRLRGTSVAEGAGVDDAVAFVGEAANLMTPVVGGGGEAVEAEYVWLIVIARTLVVGGTIEAGEGHQGVGLSTGGVLEAMWVGVFQKCVLTLEHSLEAR